MAQPGINAKIEELQFRIKTDPKSRLFFPLAEELRKNGRLPEAEQVLRTGLVVHATYLSAWVSLGRVLREQQKNAEAVDALNTAMQVDPGNVVAARLLADAYLDLGERVEAIKKYKLVHALMPSDEELEAKIEQLDRDLQAAAPEPFAPAGSHPESPFAEAEPEYEPQPVPVPVPEAEPEYHPQPMPVPESEPEPQKEPEPEPAFAATADVPFAPLPRDNPFDEPLPVTPTMETPFETGDEVPMAVEHAESPFDETAGFTAAALEIEKLDEIQVEEAPFAAEPPAAPAEEHWEIEPVAVFAPEEPEPGPQPELSPEPEAAAQDDDITATTTMADLYVRQGLIGEARKIYEHILQRDPYDLDVRTKLEDMDARYAVPPPGHGAAELPVDHASEPVDDLEAESTQVTWRPGTSSTETVKALWQPSTEDEATWQPEDQATPEEKLPQPGNPATLRHHARVVALEQWLAKVSRREPRGA